LVVQGFVSGMAKLRNHRKLGAPSKSIRCFIDPI
jgi:hypothetical protein